MRAFILAKFAGLIRIVAAASALLFANSAHAIEYSALEGKWEGGYSCAQGFAQATVNIWKGSGKPGGLFAFRPPPGGAGKSGEYYFDLKISGDEVLLQPTRWKRQATGYLMVPARMRFVGPDRLRGRMNARGCGEINLARVGAAASATAAESVAAGEGTKAPGAAPTPVEKPSRPGQTGRPWIGRSPTDLIDGKNFFQAVGVSESLLREKARIALKDEIRFFPVRNEGSVSLGTYGPNNRRRSIDEYLLLFCASKQTTCVEPYKYIEGGVVVRFSDGEPMETYVHFHIASLLPRNRYCTVEGADLRCRIEVPYGTDKQMWGTGGNTRALIESIRDGYSYARHPADIDNNIATSGAARRAKELLGCVEYPSQQSYYVFVDESGREVSERNYDEPSYFIGNRCSFTIHVAVRVDAEGGCPFRFGEVMPNAVLGGSREYVLKSGQAGHLGHCRGTITILERR